MISSGIMKRVRPGDDIETYCGRCKDERTHQIVALNSSGVPEQVTCRTCHNTHLYRKARTQSTKSSATGPRQKSQGRASASVPHGPTRAYAPYETFEKDQLISHPKFGTGQVLEVRAGKIDVKFSDGQRTLLHGG